MREGEKTPSRGWGLERREEGKTRLVSSRKPLALNIEKSES